MYFVFVTGGLDFNGDSLNKEGLGGSETALASMSRALAKRGHRVTVYCNCSKPGIFEEVQYRDASEFEAQAACMHYDVLVVSRWMEYLMVRSTAGLRVLWLHDMPTDPQRLMSNLVQTDLILGLSDFHVSQYVKMTPELEKHFWKTSNGVDLDLINECQKPKVPGKVIYTSRPERGLDILLGKVFPKLLEKHPNLRLYFCNYSLQNIQIPDSVRRSIENTQELAAKYPNNIFNLGHLSKKSLYQHISSAQLLLYPTNFPEVSCITAMESQACGTPIVTTDAFALSETVRGGVRVEGDANSDEYVDKFVDAASNLLSNKELYDAAVKSGYAWIEERGYTWDRVAAKWEQHFSQIMQDRAASKPVEVVKTLERAGDLVPAKLIADKHNLSEISSALDTRIKAAKYEMNLEETLKRTRMLLTRFRAIVEMFRTDSFQPKKILDFNTPEYAFSILFRKAIQDCTCTALAVDEQVAEQLSVISDRNNLGIDVVRTEEEIPENYYDLVILNESLELSADPQALLKKIQDKYLADGGKVLISTRCGAERLRPDLTDGVYDDRLWNFDNLDFIELFDNGQFLYTWTADSITKTGDLNGHWSLVVNKGFKVAKLDLQSKMQRTRPYKSLSVCMITKDCENWIGGCLESIENVADEILVCDTGSSDDTIAIAKKHGAIVKEIKFDNFGQARNESIADAKGDWIFWIDADERLVEPQRIRSYLESSVYEGFIVRQNHLMLDLHNTLDKPIRLLKNRSYYKFTGLIHEHCEDVSEQPFDKKISPALETPHLDLVHYGYTNEKQRRAKCSARNMALVIRDIEESGANGRMLTWVLIIRDFINIAKWEMQRNKGPLSVGSHGHKCLNAAVSYFLHYFGDGKSIYYPATFPMYQDALKLLAASSLTFEDYPTPPFEIGLTFMGAIGGVKERDVLPKFRWFVSPVEYADFIQHRSALMLASLGLVPPEAFSEDELRESTVLRPKELPDAKALLQAGITE